ncbi:Golgi complex component 7-domain-containing protein [Cristinia sonorae]|uniref:Conserved oligomeric Golgi complex subunit 7 n=1 Tax=Cristinia sonorae TaxID=1940300 RepID=A0A8K0UCU7_9AGAR|nr:Golgi complex component 7-domain-containing protein [Cristinia sonorae]
MSQIVPTDILTSLEKHDDVVSWINEVLDAPASDGLPVSGLSDLDNRVSHLVGTLELATEDTSTQVERLIDDISRGASRLTYDLHFMRDSALALQGLLHGVEKQSQISVAADTTAALNQLYYLDTVKRNMTAAREVLREAESWSTLESDVISLLGEQNYEKAAERLSEANKSMVVFTNTPEYDTRRTLMISLQNQLEASLSSALVAAVNSQDVAVCKNYFSIFCNIQRESEFRNYYYGSRRTPLTDSWQSAQLSDCDSVSANSSLTFSAFLSTFYTSFLAMLQTERSSIPAIFPDPQSTLSTLITSTLTALQPTFSQRLASLSSHYGSKALPYLIIVYRSTEEFAVSANKILEKIGYATVLSPNPDVTPGARAQSRRRSMRMSISGISAPTPGSAVTLSGPALALGWDQELFEPFLELQVEYGSLERRLVMDALQEIMTGDVGPNTDKSRLLRERSVDVFGLGEDAIARCNAFTRGYGSVGLIASLDDLFAKFAEKSQADISSRRTVLNDNTTAASTDLADLDYTPNDWSDMQSLLHLLEAVRALRERLLGFENRLRSTLAQTSASFRSIRVNPGAFDVPGTTRGALHLLSQSTLNSIELHALLDQADPETSRPQPLSRSSGEAYLTPGPPSADPRRSPQFMTTQTPRYLLLRSRESLAAFAKSCQIALQDTILRPLQQRLISYASLPLWSVQTDPRGKRGGAAGNALSDVQIPTFSLSPSETMQRVAEGLLNLPRLFESYADDDALSFSLETLPFINAELLQSLAEPSPQPTPAAMSHSRRSPSLSFKTPPIAATSASNLVVPELTPEAVSSAWLSSLSLSLLSHLTSKVLTSIRVLTPSGAAQLASDLGYLSSIVMALNVEYDDLEKWKEYVELEDAAGKGRVLEMKGDAIFGCVARMRGWTSTV